MPLPNPTDAELAILGVLWERGPSTVREVQQKLEERQPTGYTTALKLLQIMTDKGLVTRDEANRAHIYRPLVSQSQSQQHFVNDLALKLFGGSAQKLALRALSTRKATPQELAELRLLLDTLEADAPEEDIPEEDMPENMARKDHLTQNVEPNTYQANTQQPSTHKEQQP